MGLSAIQPPRCALLVALAVVLSVVTVACGSARQRSTPPSTAAPATPVPSRSFTDGFERPRPEAGTEHARAEVTAGAARNGAFGLDVASVGSDAYLRWDARPTGTDRPFWSFRAWVRVLAWTPGQSVDLFTVRNLEAKDNFDLFVGTPDRRFQWDLFRESSASAPEPVEQGRWYLVEATGSFSTHTSSADVRIDGVPQPSIASPGQPPSAVRDFIVGSVGTRKTNRVQFDDVRIVVSDAPLELLGAPAARP
jgi:Concanavalin A-like lectin/glucanases superfamily